MDPTERTRLRALYAVVQAYMVADRRGVGPGDPVQVARWHQIRRLVHVRNDGTTARRRA